jgi:hypothetical protein
MGASYALHVRHREQGTIPDACLRVRGRCRGAKGERFRRQVPLRFETRSSYRGGPACGCGRLTGNGYRCPGPTNPHESHGISRMKAAAGGLPGMVLTPRCHTSPHTIPRFPRHPAVAPHAAAPGVAQDTADRLVASILTIAAFRLIPHLPPRIVPPINPSRSFLPLQPRRRPRTCPEANGLCIIPAHIHNRVVGTLRREAWPFPVKIMMTKEEMPI